MVVPDFIQRLSDWSEMYLLNVYGEKIIIHNDTQSPARQHSTIMHELAHLICEHSMPTEGKLPNLPFKGGMTNATSRRPDTWEAPYR